MLALAAALSATLACAGSAAPPKHAESPGEQAATPGRVADTGAESHADAPETLVRTHQNYALHDGATCRSKLPASAVEALVRYGTRCLEEARDGEHYLSVPYGEAMAALRIAAEAGDPTAQYVFGSRVFGDHFTNQAPEASEQADYVFALKYLTVAIRRGDAQAHAYFGDAGAALRGDVLPATLPMPLSEVPRAWLDEALLAARRWLGCAGAE
jgi:hypothetical protein